ncbi:helix-turn-helix transcriptional regulator [Aliiroseovarius sp. KMU-71]|uniref:helix-turn-helix transcriptional regulator n=1 Tax=Aliiroseovarius sp. KMU-71 TaxID=3453123 RepID=UPI003F44ACA1
MPEKLIRRPRVQEMTGLSRSTIYDQMERGTFPRPVRIGTRAVAWRESEVVEWMSTREAV